MNPMNETQYERIGRLLDGEPETLGAQEQAAAEEISRLENRLGGRLDVLMPRPVLDRAAQRVATKLHRPRSLAVRLAFVASAAAAAVVVATALWTQRPETPTNFIATNLLAQLSTSQLFEPVPSDHLPEIDLLEAEVNQLEADLVLAAPPSNEDMQIRSLEGDVSDFWMSDPSAPVGIEG